MYLLEIKVIWGQMMISDALKRGWETLLIIHNRDRAVKWVLNSVQYILGSYFITHFFKHLYTFYAFFKYNKTILAERSLKPCRHHRKTNYPRTRLLLFVVTLLPRNILSLG